jgi:hypothetical protein
MPMEQKAPRWNDSRVPRRRCSSCAGSRAGGVGYDGELEQAVETTTNLVGCPGRIAVATPHARRRARHVTCRMRGAGSRRPGSSGSSAAATGSVTTTWTESSQAIAPGASWTERAARGAALRVGQDGESVAAVAPEFGVGWGTVMAAVRDHADRRSTTQPGSRGCAGAGWTRPRSPPRPPPARRRSSPGSST